MAADAKSETEFGRSLKLKLNLGSVRRRKARQRRMRRRKARQRRVKDAGGGARCTNAGGGLKCRVNRRGCVLLPKWGVRNRATKYINTPKMCKKFYKGKKIEW